MTNLTNITNDPPVWLTELSNVVIYQDTDSGYYFIIPSTTGTQGTIRFKIPTLTNFGGFITGGGGGGGGASVSFCIGKGGGGGGSHLYNIYNATVSIQDIPYLILNRGSSGWGGSSTTTTQSIGKPNQNGGNGGYSSWYFSDNLNITNSGSTKAIGRLATGGGGGGGGNVYVCDTNGGYGGSAQSFISNHTDFPTDNQNNYNGGFLGGTGGTTNSNGGNGSNISNYLLDGTIRDILNSYNQPLVTSLRFGQGGGGGQANLYSGQGGQLDNMGGRGAYIYIQYGLLGGNGMTTGGGNGGGGGGQFGRGFPSASRGGSGSDGTSVIWFKYIQDVPHTPVITFSSYPNRSTHFSTTDITDYSVDPVSITVNQLQSITYNSYTGSNGDYTYYFTFDLLMNTIGDLEYSYVAENTVGSSSGEFICNIVRYQQPVLSTNTTSIALHTDTSYNLLANLTADSNILTATYQLLNMSDFSFNIVQNCSHGTLQCNNISISSLNTSSSNSGVIQYIPRPTYVGLDSFTSNFQDITNMSVTNNDGLSNSINIDITVKNPALTHDIYINTVSHTITPIDLSGVDLELYYPLTYYVDTLPTNGTLYLGTFPNNPSTVWSTPYQLGQGSSVQNFNLYYVSNEGYTGTDYFTYYVEDKHGLFSIDFEQYSDGTRQKVPSTVQLTINQLTSPPIVYDVSYIVHQNVPKIVSFSDNLPTPPTQYYIASSPISQNDTLTTINNTAIHLEYNTSIFIPYGLYQDLTIWFASTSEVLGYTIHSFNYFLVDGSGSLSNTATVYINMSPTPESQYVTTGENNPATSIYLNANVQTEYPYSYKILTYPAHGVITSISGEQIVNNTWIASTIDEQQYGYKVNYIPNKFYSGIDSFYWSLKYNDLPSDMSANVVINIYANEPPPVDVTLYISFYQYSDGIITNQRGGNSTDISLLLPELGINNYTYTINSQPTFIYGNGTSDPTYALNGSILLDVSNNYDPINTIPYILSGSAVNYNWAGTPYFGSSKFYFSVSGTDNNNIYKSYSGEVIVNLAFGKMSGCDTGPGPIPTRVWTRASGSCPNLDGAVLNGQPMTYDDLSEKRKAIIFQYNNNNAGFSKKQLYSRLARGLGKQGKKTYATQSESYTNANTHNLLLDSSSVLLCPGTTKNWAFTNQNDTPGPVRVIGNYPNVPLYNYKTQQTYSSIGNKWPQFGPYPRSNFIPGISYSEQTITQPEPEPTRQVLVPPNFNLVVYEGFDYPNDSIVNGLNGGSGEWTVPWENSYIPGSYLKIGTSGITYNNLNISGKCITFGSSSNGVAGAKRSFPSQNRGLVYVKVLVSVNAGTLGNGGTPRIGFYDNDTPVGFVGNTGDGLPNDATKTNIYNNNLTYLATTGVSLNSTRLLLFQFNYAINKSRLWVNPDLSSFYYDSPNLNNSNDLGSAWMFNTFNITVRTGASYDEVTVFEYVGQSSQP